jgi:L-amino acid N-acyltransferase YncA
VLRRAINRTDRQLGAASAPGASQSLRTLVLVLLRLATLEDAAGVAAVYAPVVETTAISFEYEAPSVDEMRRRIEQISLSHPWLIADDGAVAGYAYGAPYAARDSYRWSVAVSVYLRADLRGQGVGRRLYRALLGLLELQGFRQAFAGITLPNEASVGLHEAMGFTLVGVAQRVGYKLGSWHDVGQWQRALAIADGPPSEPTQIAALDPHAVTSLLA